ncbi:MAG: hypothetical protein JWQ74_1302 [Marmoricola sp.]|nr:hypothetical protein [Marmoricola sp.]
MNRRALRFGAIIGAATVSTLAIAPVFAAAAPVSQSTSNALTLSIAGSPISSGTVKATNDGKTETKTGETNPVVGVLGNQSLLNVGVLAQEASASVDGTDGVSAACGGIAGEGASVVNVGNSNCLNAGKPVGLSIANLDLTGSTLIDPSSAIGALAALNPIAAQLLAPITSAISSALAPLGNTGLGGTLGAVYAHCTAKPGSAEGGANIVDSKLTLSLAGTDVDLVNLPANPPPNTHVLTDLDAVLNAVIDGLKVDLNTTLDGLGAPLNAVLDAVQTNLVNTVVAQVADALAPLEDNILDITLNKQVKTSDTIDITALDLQLLPAAAQFTGSSLVAAQIGHISCGPNRTIANPTPTPTPTPEPTPGPPKVPTIVDSGLSGSADHTARDVLAATAALMLLAGSAGLIGYRRLLTK